MRVAAGVLSTPAELTGDATTTLFATTFATVNSNVGSFGSTTAIPAVTVNEKGLVTAVSTSVVVAPAGTLTGATLAAGVTASSLTSVGASIALGTPASVMLTNATGLPVGGIAVGVMRGFIDGVGTIRASATTITVNAGCARDGTDAYSLYLPAATTKTLQAAGAWAGGTGNNGLDTGARANSTTYHVWLIAGATGNGVDVLFSLSATAPTMPPTYTLKRLIGSIRTDVLGDIIGYIQDGDDFQWLVPFADIAAANPGTAAVTRTLTLPTGRRLKAILAVGAGAALAVDNPGGIYISDLSVTDMATAINGVFSQDQYSGAVVITQSGSVMSVYTNTSAQVRSRVQISTAGTTLYICTLGWTDSRGRNA